MTSAPPPPPGWYSDPQMPQGHLRYWDGTRWSEHRSSPVSPYTHANVQQPAMRGSRSWLGWVVAGVVALGAIGVATDEGEPLATAGASEAGDQVDEVDKVDADEVGGDDDDSGEVANTAETGVGEPEVAAEPAAPADPPRAKTDEVAGITDGDTLVLASGESVRLVGIDAPESGDCGSLRAAEMLTRLALGQRVTLVSPVRDRDRYDRLLRYVDVGSLDAGLRLIQRGLAIARYDSRDGYEGHARQQEYIRADAGSAPVVCAPPPEPATFADTGSNCAPGYTPCVAQYPPDLDCADTGPVAVTGADPHGLDADGDGVACGGD